MKTSYLLLAIVCVFMSAQPVYAYVGPGLGAGTLGVLLGIIASVFLALFAVVWYPIKRLFRGRKRRVAESD